MTSAGLDLPAGDFAFVEAVHRGDPLHRAAAAAAAVAGGVGDLAALLALLLDEGIIVSFSGHSQPEDPRR